MAGLDVSGFLEVNPDDKLELSVRGLPSRLFVEEGRITITNDRVEITQENALRGRTLGGAFGVWGGVDLVNFAPTVAEVMLEAFNITYNVSGLVRVTLDVPELVVHADLSKLSPEARKSSRFNAEEDLFVRGIVNISDGLFYKNYNFQSDLFQQLQSQVAGRRTAERVDFDAFRGDTLLTNLALDLEVHAKESFRVRNEIAGNPVDIDIGLDMKVSGTLKELGLDGVVELTGGDFELFGHEFEIMPNSRLDFSPEDSFNPNLNITAQAEINTQSNFLSAISDSSALDRRRPIRAGDIARGAQIYIVSVAVTGLLNVFEIELTSTPTLSQNDIVTLLLTGQTLADLGSNPENPTLSVAFDTLVAPFVEAQVGNVISAEAFQFSIADGAAQLVYIQQVTDRLRIAGGISLAGADGNRQAIGGEYRFLENVSVELTGQNESDEGLMLNLQMRYLLPLD